MCFKQAANYYDNLLFTMRKDYVINLPTIRMQSLCLKVIQFLSRFKGGYGQITYIYHK